MAGVDGIRTGVQRTAPEARTAPLDPEATRKLVETIRGAVALSPEEKNALAALNPTQRAQYQAVAARLTSPERELVAKLLVEGKLTGGRDYKLRGDVLANLANLATEPPDSKIDRKTLLAAAISAIADPTSISQGNAETCGAATAQILLARTNPAEYVRILAGLASRDGQVQLVNGEILKRPPGWAEAPIEGAASQLLQTAFMDYAAGGYDAATDTRSDGKKGLYASEAAYLQEGLMGKAINTIHGNGPDVLAKIAAQANAGRPVSVLIEFEGKGHYVQITGVSMGQISYIDPRDGKARTVDQTGFAPLIRAANLEADPGTAVKKARPTDQKGIMGGCVGAIVDAIVKVAKSAVNFIADTVKSAVSAVTNVVKAAFNAVVSTVKATIAVFKTIAKTALTLAQTALRVTYYLATLKFGSAVSALKDGAKEAWNEVKEGAKEFWKHTKDALKEVGKVITNTIKLAEAIVPGFKVVTDFLKSEIGQKILMGLGILALIPPLTAILGPVMLVIALYQGTEMLGKGLENGDFKTAALGALTVAASVVGLKAAAAKAAAQAAAKGAAAGAATAGSQAAAQTAAASAAAAQKTLNIVSGVAKAGLAIEAGNWKGAILSGASAGAAMGGGATMQNVTNLATKGFAVADAAKNKDWLAAGAAAAALGIGGLAMASANVDDDKPKSWIAQKAEDVKNWLGEKWDAFKDSGVGKVVLAPVNLAKAGLDATDAFFFGEKINVTQPDGTVVQMRKPDDGLVPKAQNWWGENVQKPVANAFAPVKDKLVEWRKAGDEGIATVKANTLDKVSGAVDGVAYGKDGDRGIVGTAKGVIKDGFQPVKDGVAKGTAMVREGVSDAVNKAKTWVPGEKPPAPPPAAIPGGPGAPIPGTAPVNAPAATGAPGAPPAEKAWYQKAWDWASGKAAAAEANTNKLMNKVDAVHADVNRAQQNLSAKLDAINKTHDTFMAGVETVRAVQDGNTNKALAQGGKFLTGVGYTDMGAGLGTVAQKAEAGERVRKAVKDNDVGAGLQAAGNLASLRDVEQTGKKVVAGQRAYDAVKAGETAAAISRAAEMTDSEGLKDVGQRLTNAEAAQKAIERGDRAAAMQYLGAAAGSKAVQSAGETYRHAENAKTYAERGDYGEAIAESGRALDDRDIQDVGRRVDAGQTAAAAAGGKDRRGNQLTEAGAAAAFLGASGEATDSDELQTGGMMVTQGDNLNKAIEKQDKAAAMQASANLAGTLGREQASKNIREARYEEERRERLARDVGDAVEGERTVELVERIAATQGLEPQPGLEASEDARRFARRADNFGRLVDSAASVTHDAQRLAMEAELELGSRNFKKQSDNARRVVDDIAQASKDAQDLSKDA